MSKIKLLLIYIVLMTWVFAQLDWRPIHNSYLKYNNWPHESVETWWSDWSKFRYNTALILCPPCAALAEHYYFVFFEIEAGLDEQNDLLLKHIPAGNEYEGVLSPHGFWWGQGGEDNHNEWKRVSLISWYLYWLPYTLLWWFGWKSAFHAGRIIVSWIKSHKMTWASISKSRTWAFISSLLRTGRSPGQLVSYNGVYLNSAKPGFLEQRLLRRKTSK